jgi:hypothetical protein
VQGMAGTIEKARREGRAWKSVRRDGVTRPRHPFQPAARGPRDL